MWPNLAKFCYFAKILQVFGKMLRLLWRICYIVGLIFIVENGQIVKNSIDIWSHWFLCLTVRHHSLFLQRHPIFLSLSLCMSLISLSLSFVRWEFFAAVISQWRKSFQIIPKKDCSNWCCSQHYYRRKKMELSRSFEWLHLLVYEIHLVTCSLGGFSWARTFKDAKM